VTDQVECPRCSTPLVLFVSPCICRGHGVVSKGVAARYLLDPSGAPAIRASIVSLTECATAAPEEWETATGAPPDPARSIEFNGPAEGSTEP
jgi:hypothetical protein